MRHKQKTAEEPSIGSVILRLWRQLTAKTESRVILAGKEFEQKNVYEKPATAEHGDWSFYMHVISVFHKNRNAVGIYGPAVAINKG